MSPALAGGFFTTEPLGKPWQTLILATFLTPYLWQAKWRSHTPLFQTMTTKLQQSKQYGAGMVIKTGIA